MPRKPDPLRAQIKALEALVKADKAEQRAVEAPVRAARRELSELLRRAVRSVDRFNQLIADQLFDKGFGLMFFNSFKLDDAERGLVDATATFKQRLLDLQLFDAANNIEADYAQLPVLDREAAIAVGRADYQQRMATFRASLARPPCPAAPPKNPLDALFGPMPPPTHEPEYPR